MPASWRVVFQRPEKDSLQTFISQQKRDQRGARNKGFDGEEADFVMRSGALGPAARSRAEVVVAAAPSPDARGPAERRGERLTQGRVEAPSRPPHAV